MGSHCLLRRIVPTQESNLGILQWQADSLSSELPEKLFALPVFLSRLKTWDGDLPLVNSELRKMAINKCQSLLQAQLTLLKTGFLF